METPLLLPGNAPEEYIDPLEVPLSPSSPLSWQLQTSPEMCMKRLLARGHRTIYQISHCWRAGERGDRHLSEFTMLEWYRAEADYGTLMDDCRDLLQHVAAHCAENAVFSHNGRYCDPHAPWVTMRVSEAFSDFSNTEALAAVQNGLFEAVLNESIEPALKNYSVPVILQDYPSEMAALARLKADDPQYAERFELYLCGLELANGFSELTDPVEQRRRFQEACLVREQRGVHPGVLPERFLDELSAVPPSAGIALGLDRLVMLTLGAERIDQVVAFSPESL